MTAQPLVRHSLVALLVLPIFSEPVGAEVPGRATAADPRPGQLPMWALPPTSGAAMRQLLSPPADQLPGDYQFAGASIDRSFIVARYRSASRSRTLKIKLGHPEQLRHASAHSGRFALRFEPPHRVTLPHASALQQAVVANVKRHESAWHWIRVSHPPPAFEPLHLSGRTAHRALFVLFMMTVLGGPCLGLLLHIRRRHRDSKGRVV